MKRSNEVSLRLEVLEDRMALNGAFSGAIGAGIPFPFNALTVQSTGNNSQPGFRDSFFPTGNTSSGSTSSFQSQFQAFQSAEIKLVDQFFSQLGIMLQPFNLHTFVII